MLAHDFTDMPGQLGDQVLRCKWCMKTPTKAREDGCAIHELEEKGSILLAQFNPGGVEYFKGRDCVTCHAPIMVHYLRKGSSDYWCFETLDQISEGINDCKHDVSMVQAPVEQTEPRRPFSVQLRMEPRESGE